MENADALVLRTVDFSETSLILTLYTRQFGKIEALAKGGRRLKSPFESALDILARIRVTFLHKKRDVLDLLTEAKLVRRFHVSRSNLAGLFAGYYVAELVDSFTAPHDPNPPLYDLTVKLLARLEEGTFLMRSLIRFEGLLLRAIGQQLTLRNCAECGQIPNPNLTKLVFGISDGGVLCPDCVRKIRQQENPTESGLDSGLVFGQTRVQQHWISVSAEALRGMEQLSDPRDRTENWKRMTLEKNVQNEIRGLNNYYITYTLGRRPRMYDWLKFIAQNDRTE